LRLESVQLLGDRDRGSCLRLAAALEQASEHPIAHALCASVDSPAAASDIVATPGLGIEGSVDGQRYRIGVAAYVSELQGQARNQPVAAGDYPDGVVLGDAQGLLAHFSFVDRLRARAAESVAQLQGLGLEVELLSGDRLETVQAVAQELGIARYSARCQPQDKLARINELQRQGAVVAMVGDGVNDAPVLAAAQVSLAMGSGTQLAHASADMVLLSEQLPHLAAAVRTSRRTLRVIRQNLGWALVYNLVAVPLAAGGWVAPWMAAIGMSSSSLVVVLNALRLRTMDSE
jgi:Cu2+-exporting ATPase